LSNRFGSHSLLVGAFLGTLLWVTGSTYAHPFVGIVDDFKGPDANGWSGGTPTSNPGTGGVDGAGDGYLLLSAPFPGNYGSRGSEHGYVGSYLEAGVTLVSFYLNDVQAPDLFAIHFLITGGVPETTWQYNAGFSPPNNQWQRYSVDLTDETKWTRTSGSGTFAEVLNDVVRIHFRHDLPPYAQFPDPIAGTLGIDNIELATDCNGNSIPDRLEPDADNDRIIDACDACPNTVLGTPVDVQGCPVPIPGDFDRDGAVGPNDFDHFAGCVLGPSVAQLDPLCASADLDHDSDVDQRDFGIFQKCYRGANLPANPACAAQ
jgi:hypothetical protein